MADYAIHEETLQDIAGIIRKKDGTQAGIDPATYADRINLMGMLEEKTATGSIAHITDGADEVPIKAWEVTLPASLDGYSSVEVVHTGSNVWDEDYALGLWNASGEWYGNTQGYMSSKTHISVKPSTQYCFINGGNTSFYICYYDENKTFIRRDTLAYPSQRVITTPSNCYFVNFSTYSAYGTTYNNDIALNYPSTFTEYAHYSGETHTVNLGRTIYGGTVDVVKGQGTDGHGIVDLGTLTWTKRNTYSGHWRFTTQDVPVAINEDSSYIPSMDCIEYDAISATESYRGVKGVSCNIGISQLMVCDESYETASDFKTAVSGVYLVYPLATPTDFTFTPITPTPETALGVNNFWADEGDSEVTYRSMGTVYQYPEGEGVSF